MAGNSTDPCADAERLAAAYQVQYPTADIAIYPLPRTGGWAVIVLLAHEGHRGRAINAALSTTDVPAAILELAALSGHVSVHGHTPAAIRLKAEQG